jgi:hypothetical protein
MELSQKIALNGKPIIVRSEVTAFIEYSFPAEVELSGVFACPVCERSCPASLPLCKGYTRREAPIIEKVMRAPDPESLGLPREKGTLRSYQDAKGRFRGRSQLAINEQSFGTGGSL